MLDRRPAIHLLALALACGLPAWPRPAFPEPRPAQAPPAATPTKPKATPAKGAKPARPGAASAKPDADAALQKDVAMQAELKRQARRKARKAPKYRGPLVNLNAASREELMKLPSVSAAVADKLLAGRPYRTKADLVTRDIVPYGIYSAIKDRVVATPPSAPK